MTSLFADAAPTATDQLLQFLINGLSFGMLIALIALGYTMVYGIIELINFAHGDLFMLGSFVAFTFLTEAVFRLFDQSTVVGPLAVGVILVALVLSMTFCAGLNLAVDRVVYKPLRTAPKLAPFVSAIGVSFIFMNLGLFWGGSQDVNFPALVPDNNLLDKDHLNMTDKVTFSTKDALVFAVTIPLMIGLTLFVKRTPLGKAMRATAQNPVAARLMGINTDRVIGATFLIGGALAGASSVIYALKIGTIQFTQGFQNGLYAFTAAVLGGIGNIPGAVLGGLLIGLIRALGSAYVGEKWTGALVFATLIVLLVFRPQGLLGARVREKV
jgi:branched-chain amino acid transport system permease protein